MKPILCATSLFFTLTLALSQDSAETVMLEDIYLWHPPGANDCLLSLFLSQCILMLIRFCSQRSLPNDEHTRKPWFHSPATVITSQSKPPLEVYKGLLTSTLHWRI